MGQKTLLQKLGIKPGNRVELIGAPAGYAEQLLSGETPFTMETGGSGVDVLQVFLRSLAELHAGIAGWKGRLAPGGILWVCYPKGTSGIKTDINRDIIWREVKQYGLDAVAMFAVDDTWSAMRLKRVD